LCFHYARQQGGNAATDEQVRMSLLTGGYQMLDTAKALLLTLSALFPIVNPLGGSPVFLTYTSDCSTDTRRDLAKKVALNSFFVLVGSYFIGSYILEFFGISLPVVQVGGGLIVISTGWSMLKQGNGDKRRELDQKGTPEGVYGHAFYPLTLPLTTGPGSISVAITLGANSAHQRPVHVLGAAAALLATALIALSVYLCYAFADRLARVLGAKGMSVLQRLSSFLLVCIGVQIFWNGASSLLKSLLLNVH
jgi:multiple antibiotic resistance protein